MDALDDGHDPFGSYYDDDSNNSELSRRLILLSSVFLSVVMFLLFFIYLYIRCVLNTRHSRRLSLTLHLHHTELVPPPTTTGLDPALVAALPVFIVKPKAQEADGVMECAVCLSALQDEEMAKLLPNCKHSFHVGCIDTWLASHSTCPLCRARVQPRLEPQLREGPTSLPLEDAAHLLVLPPLEPSQGASDGGGGESSKIDGSGSRLSSFRRVLSRERSSRRTFQPSSLDGVHQDLERQ